jgi:hypothetical protein
VAATLAEEKTAQIVPKTAACHAEEKASQAANNHSAETDVKRTMEEGGEERASDADHEKAQNFPDTTSRSKRGGQVHCSMREGGNLSLATPKLTGRRVK